MSNYWQRVLQCSASWAKNIDRDFQLCNPVIPHATSHVGDSGRATFSEAAARTDSWHRWRRNGAHYLRIALIRGFSVGTCSLRSFQRSLRKLCLEPFRWWNSEHELTTHFFFCASECYVAKLEQSL